MRNQGDQQIDSRRAEAPAPITEIGAARQRASGAQAQRAVELRRRRAELGHLVTERESGAGGVVRLTFSDGAVCEIDRNGTYRWNDGGLGQDARAL